MRVLAVDIGTNSTLHLVADVTRNNLSLVERGISGNKLGVSLTAELKIPPDVIELNRQLLASIVQRAAELGCQRMGAVGTQALREAVNRDELLNCARELGLEITGAETPASKLTGAHAMMLSPAEEALLGWRGVFSPAGPDQSTALLDLGGGSCQLTIGAGAAPQWSESIPLGAVKLARQCFQNDPPTADEVAQAIEVVRFNFQRWGNAVERGTPLTGVGGTITALSALQQSIASYQPGLLEGRALTRWMVTEWRGRLMKLTLAERRVLPGMPPARAYAIHSGALILAELTALLGAEELTVSERGVMFGLAYRLGEVG